MLMNANQEHSAYLPEAVCTLENPQSDIPRIAKDHNLLKQIEASAQQIP
ncbi:hypothetical protein THIOM_003675, partial [Candidatus Thiomargarita nelsonii]